MSNKQSDAECEAKDLFKALFGNFPELTWARWDMKRFPILLKAIRKAEKRGLDYGIKNKCQLIKEAAEQNLREGLKKAMKIACKIIDDNLLDHCCFTESNCGKPECQTLHKVAKAIKAEIKK